MTSTVNDVLPSSVPMLDQAGGNWAIFRLRFEMAIRGKGLWGHFDGTRVRPVTEMPKVSVSPPSASTAQASSAPATAATAVDRTSPSATVLLGTPGEILEWDRCESIAMSLLSQRLPNSTLLLASNQPTAAKMWETIKKDFTYKGAFSQTRMRRDFLSTRCPKDGNVRTFLNDLRSKRAELDAMGISINNDDYRSTIIQSLPYTVSGFASGQLTAATLRGDTIDPDMLILVISDEWDRTQSRSRNHKKENDSGDDAMSVDHKGKGKRKDGPGPCWKCGGPHLKRDCPKKKKDSDEKSDKGSGNDKARNSANAVDDDDAAFTVEEIPRLIHTEIVELGEFFEEDLEFEGEQDEACATIVELEDDATHVQDQRSSNLRIELFDSGASRHISPYRNAFSTFQSIPPHPLRAANKETFCAKGKGEMILDLPNGVGTSKLKLTDVLYAPEVGYTLVSIGRLEEAGFTTMFANGKCVIRDGDHTRIAEIPRNKNGLYKLVHEVEGEVHAVENLTLDILHRRLGHIAPAAARKLVKEGLVTGLELETDGDTDIFCESCAFAKATRLPIAKERKGEGASEFGQEVHSDVWGPAKVATRKGRRYYVTFTDDYSRWTHITFLEKKSDVFQAYKDFEMWCETQLKARIRTLHSDRGGEYTSTEFKQHLKSRGMEAKLTVHDTPQHNGVAERRNRTIIERGRAIFHATKHLPKYLWAEAASHVVWLMNRTGTKAVAGKTPYEAVFGRKPDLGGLREWGTEVWVHDPKGDKWDGRAIKGRWLGYDAESNGSRIWFPDSGSVKIERNFRFVKNSPPSLEGEQEIIIATHKTSGDNIPINPETIDPKSAEPEILEPDQATPQDEPQTRFRPSTIKIPERPHRLRTPSPKAKDILEGRAVMVAEELEWEEVWVFASETGEIEALEPTSLKDAQQRTDWPLWKRAIEEELGMLTDAGTWELTEAPKGVNVVGCKWVFKAKKDAAGNVVRYKARLVAQGFSQVPGVDYFDTYAPVARLSSIRAVLAIAASKDMEIHQIDIKGAYLNGRLADNEIIYMKQPPGFHDSSHPGKVCRLVKTLYGLKQSGRRWYQRLCEILVDNLGLSRCDVDNAVFFKSDPPNLIIILVHVDDCTIVTNKLELVDWLKKGVAEHVEITDLGEIHWLLGIEVKRDRMKGEISLSQGAYIDASIRLFWPRGFKTTQYTHGPLHSTHDRPLPQIDDGNCSHGQSSVSRSSRKANVCCFRNETRYRIRSSGVVTIHKSPW